MRSEVNVVGALVELNETQALVLWAILSVFDTPSQSLADHIEAEWLTRIDPDIVRDAAQELHDNALRLVNRFPETS